VVEHLLPQSGEAQGGVVAAAVVALLDHEPFDRQSL
jgi:hypothetical protein